jgi:phenylpropionate dioxygenase-like ring-hydroxylating dioxygenase large terminal subunit
MNTDDYGLAEVEQEIWRGFVFVRFAPGLPSVAEQMAPYADELAGAPLEDLVPLGRPRAQTRQVNWKNVADNYSDGLHIPVAHPGLTRVFGKSYAIEAREWVDKMSGQLVDRPSNVPSERMYHTLLHDLGLGKSAQWAYYKLWPNAAIEVYPDQVDFMQFVPVSPTETTLRYINYGLPDERREMNALRYLNWRINRLVNLEDKDLIERVQAGMASSSYAVGPLGEGEVCLRSFGRRMRALFPELRERAAPPKGWSFHRKPPRPQ